MVHSEIVVPPVLPPVVEEDPSDDKFLECAVAEKPLASLPEISIY